MTAFARRRPGTGGPKGDDDLDVLNYALTLEHFEAAFCNAGYAHFSESQYESYIASQGFGSAVSSSAWQRLMDVRNHDNDHVAALTSVIQHLGGTPVPPCVYDFSGPLSSVACFVATALVLDDTGVSAYT